MFLATASSETRPKSTTFADLFFHSDLGPWEIVGIVLIAALVGMFTHWAKVHYKERAQVSVYDWFFVLNKAGTVFAVLGMLGALFVAFAPLDYTNITAYQAASQAWAIGYAADSVFNSSETKREAGETREAKLSSAAASAASNSKKRGGING